MPKAMPTAEQAVKIPKKILPWIIGFVLLCAAFLGGYSLGIGQTDDAFQLGRVTGWDEARGQLAASGLIPEPTSTVIEGAITAIGDGQVTIAVPQTVVNPLENPAPLERQVLIDDSTQVMTIRQMTPEELAGAFREFQRDNQDYLDALASGQADAVAPTAPSPDISQPAELGDLAVGDTVKVTSNQDISRLGSFTATEIGIRSHVSAVPSVPTIDESAAGPPGA